MFLKHFIVACSSSPRTVALYRLVVSFSCVLNYTQKQKFFTTRHVSSAQAGFTLIEVLVVLSIVTLIIGATLMFDVNSYRGEAFRAERNNLVVALQTARADALNNINQMKHGVKINTDEYVIFEGSTFDDSLENTRKKIPLSYPVTLGVGSPDEIVFNQLSGDSIDGEIVLIDPERNMTTNIIINHEGKIGW